MEEVVRRFFALMPGIFCVLVGCILLFATLKDKARYPGWREDLVGKKITIAIFLVLGVLFLVLGFLADLSPK